MTITAATATTIPTIIPLLRLDPPLMALGASMAVIVGVAAVAPGVPTRALVMSAASLAFVKPFAAVLAAAAVAPVNPALKVTAMPARRVARAVDVT